jgi:hypothetical protein
MMSGGVGSARWRSPDGDSSTVDNDRRGVPYGSRRGLGWPPNGKENSLGGGEGRWFTNEG